MASGQPLALAPTPTARTPGAKTREEVEFEAEVEKLIREIWNYVYSFTDGPPMQYNAKTASVSCPPPTPLFCR